MLTLPERIDVFEQKVNQAVEAIRSLKNERLILIKENERLKKDIDQLRRRVGNKEEDRLEIVGETAVINNSKIDAEQLKIDIDKCISDLDECMKMVRQSK